MVTENTRVQGLSCVFTVRSVLNGSRLDGSCYLGQQWWRESGIPPTARLWNPTERVAGSATLDNLAMKRLERATGYNVTDYNKETLVYNVSPVMIIPN